MTKEERLVDLLSRMVKTKSYSGEEGAMAELCKTAMEAYGFDEVQIVKFGSVLGRVKGNRPGKIILFDGHMDTVDVVDAAEWTHDPFGAEIADGKLYGRGAADMKSGDAAMLEAVGRFIEAHGHDFAGEIYVSCSVHEECFEGVACREISKLVKPDFVVSPEPTGMVLLIGQMGRAEIFVETEGVACHSSNPDEGVNAVKHMVKLLDEIFKIEPKVGPVGRGILELVDIISSPYPGASVVPSLCRATFDRRTLPEEKLEDVLGPIEAAIERVKEQVPNLKAKAYLVPAEAPCWTGETITADRFFPGWKLEEDHEFVQAAVAALGDVGIEPKLTCAHFCTNNSHFGGEAGIPAIIVGPEMVQQAHTRDEYVRLEKLHQACEFYGKLLERILR